MWRVQYIRRDDVAMQWRDVCVFTRAFAVLFIVIGSRSRSDYIPLQYYCVCVV